MLRRQLEETKRLVTQILIDYGGEAGLEKFFGNGGLFTKILDYKAAAVDEFNETCGRLNSELASIYAVTHDEYPRIGVLKVGDDTNAFTERINEITRADAKLDKAIRQSAETTRQRCFAPQGSMRGILDSYLRLLAMQFKSNDAIAEQTFEGRSARLRDLGLISSDDYAMLILAVNALELALTLKSPPGQIAAEDAPKFFASLASFFNSRRFDAPAGEGDA